MLPLLCVGMSALDINYSLRSSSYSINEPVKAVGGRWRDGYYLVCSRLKSLVSRVGIVK